MREREKDGETSIRQRDRWVEGQRCRYAMIDVTDGDAVSVVRRSCGCNDKNYKL